MQVDPAGMHTDLSNTIPIVIGNVPLRTAMQELNQNYERSQTDGPPPVMPLAAGSYPDLRKSYSDIVASHKIFSDLRYCSAFIPSRAHFRSNKYSRRRWAYSYAVRTETHVLRLVTAIRYQIYVFYSEFMCQSLLNKNHETEMSTETHCK